MAIVQNDPFPGTDYNSYMSWKQVKTPDGQVYYVVPNNSGYVFDPVASDATGRKVFRRNPQGDITKQQEEEERRRKLQEQESFNRSPTGQLMPVAAGTAGLIAANYALKPGVSAVGMTPQGVLMSDGTIKGVAAASNAVAPTAGTAAAQAGLPVAGEAGFIGPVAPAAQSGFALEGVGAAGNYILPALGAIGAYDVLANDRGPVRGALQGAASGAAIGSGFGGVGAIPGAIIGGALGLGRSLFDNHETTRERQAKVTNRLVEQAGDDQNAINYVTGMREQFNAGPQDPSKPFAGGKYGSWQEYKDAGLMANDLTGVEGNIETYTPQVWANLTQQQREAVTQANIDSGIYDSKDGGVQITDKTKAKENFDNVMKGFDVGVQTAGQAAAGAAPPRSTTRSPGIGLNGLPITKGPLILRR